MITKTFVCANCKNEFSRTDYPSAFKAYKHKCCSKRCALIFAREQYRPKQEAVLSSNGHIYIRHKNHPNANKNDQVPLAHIIMEIYLGRYLKKNEVVHHIDLNPHNNNIDNLSLMTLSEHVKLHNALKERNEHGQFTKMSKVQNGDDQEKLVCLV